MTEAPNDAYHHSAPLEIHHRNGPVQHEVPVTLTDGPVNPDYRLSADTVLLAASQEIALKRAKTDSLLGIGTRSSLDEDLPRFVERAQRGGDPLVVQFIDVANLGGLNKAYGHTGADKLLQATAQAIKHDARPSDRIYRWGGDEMVVVKPAYHLEGVENPDEIFAKRDHHLEAAAAQQLDQEMAKLSFDNNYAEGIPYAGLRVVSAVLKPGETHEELFKRLDTLLTARKAEDKAALQHQGITY